MDHVHVALGKSVLRAIIAADLTVPQAAEATAISPKRLQRLIDGKGSTTFSVVELHQLSRLVGKPMAKLLPKELA